MTITDEIRAIAKQLDGTANAHLAHQLRLLSLDVANMEQVLATTHEVDERARLIAALMLESVRERHEAAVASAENVVRLSHRRALRSTAMIL